MREGGEAEEKRVEKQRIYNKCSGQHCSKQILIKKLHFNWCECVRVCCVFAIQIYYGHKKCACFVWRSYFRFPSSSRDF